MKSKYVAIPLVIVLIVGSLVYFSYTSARTIEVRWLLGHQPTDVFARATSVFAEELKKRSNGEMILSVVTPEDIGIAQGDIPHAEVLRQLGSRDVEIASVYTVALGHEQPLLWSLNLPFLFSDYDGVSAVLDGASGGTILDSVVGKTSVRALAFTMSGGFRVIASPNTQVRSPQDLKGKRIATSGGPVAEATLEALGAVPVSLTLEHEQPDLTGIDGVELTYARLSSILGVNTAYKKYINETNHNVFLTAIVVGNDFYDGLSPQHRKALEDAATIAAQVEREDSIALGETTKQSLIQQGSKIIPLSSSERALFVKSTAPVYVQFESLAGQLIDALRTR